MNKTTAGILVAVISVGLIGGIVYSNNNDNRDSDSMSNVSTENKPNTEAKKTDSAMSDQIQTGKVAMDIADFDFQNMKLKVKVGTTVTWTNKDSAKHDISPDMDSPDFIGSGKLLAKGESYSYTFQKAGSFAYHCTPHPYMKANVEVSE